MKRVSLLVVGFLCLGALPALAESSLDVPLPLPTRDQIKVASVASGEGISRVMMLLAQASGVPIVFEVDTKAATLAQPVNIAGYSLRALLDFFVQAYPSYEWKDVKGVVVVRPRAEWSDPNCFFNRRIASVSMQDVTAHDVYRDAVAMVWGIEKARDGQLRDPHTFSVSSQGTALDLLIASAGARGDMVWLLGTLFGAPAKPDFALGYWAFEENGRPSPDPHSGASGIYAHPKFRTAAK